MSERCELSDLLVDQCACRIHNPPAWQQPVTIVARFDARFDSECDNCGNWMSEGDPIARTQDGDYICSGCAS
jgi:hypothetical protein